MADRCERHISANGRFRGGDDPSLPFLLFIESSGKRVVASRPSRLCVNAIYAYDLYSVYIDILIFINTCGERKRVGRIVI